MKKVKYLILIIVFTLALFTSHVFAENYSVSECLESKETTTPNIEEPNDNSKFGQSKAVITDSHENVKEESQKKILDHEIKLKNLEKYYESEKQKIEKWYLDELNKLEKYSTQKNDELEHKKKLAELQCTKELNDTVTVKDEYLIANSYGQANTNFIGDNYAVTNEYEATDAYSMEISHTYVKGDPVDKYNQEVNRINASKQSVQNEFDLLKREKENRLNCLKQEMKTKKSMIQINIKNTKIDTVIRLKGGVGQIDAIFFNDTNPAMIFQGRIHREGDYIRDFRIKKIYPNKVEFVKKDGRIYVQDK